MDKDKLKARLQPFIQDCERDKRALDDVCILEGMEGEPTDTYVVRVKAAWADDMICSKVLDYLLEKLWANSDEEIRRSILYIDVHDSKDQWHCTSDERPLNQ
jgi:hypothetical protein